MIKAQKGVFRYISVTNNMPLLDSVLKKNPILKLIGKKPNIFFQFASHIVKGRLANEDVEDAPKEKGRLHSDLLGSFIAARSNYPDVMTDLRITHYATTNVVAGANNSALAMDRTIHYLAHHPEAQERLYEEITRTNTADLEYSDRDGPLALDLALRMKYLEAVIQESYRLFASPSNNLERVVSANGLKLPNGVHLPPGAVVCMNGPALMHRADVFGKDVDAFDPDRWLPYAGEREEEFAVRRQKMSAAMLPFGHGSRTCIGKNVVQLELYKIWPVLIKNYTVGTELGHRTNEADDLLVRTSGRCQIAQCLCDGKETGRSLKRGLLPYISFFPMTPILASKI
jgi:cytochrome P450